MVVLTVLFITSILNGQLHSLNCCPIIVDALLVLLSLLFLFTAPSFPKVTAVVGLWGWTAVSLLFGSLIMFYRCSRYFKEILHHNCHRFMVFRGKLRFHFFSGSKDPGYIKANSGDSDTDVCNNYLGCPLWNPFPL